MDALPTSPNRFPPPSRPSPSVVVQANPTATATATVRCEQPPAQRLPSRTNPSLLMFGILRLLRTSLGLFQWLFRRAKQPPSRPLIMQPPAQPTNIPSENSDNPVIITATTTTTTTSHAPPSPSPVPPEHRSSIVRSLPSPPPAAATEHPSLATSNTEHHENHNSINSSALDPSKPEHTYPHPQEASSIVSTPSEFPPQNENASSNSPPRSFRATPTTTVIPAPNDIDLPVVDDIIAFSAQICAAARACETQLPPAVRLFDDPLAEPLAGPIAMERARRRYLKLDHQPVQSKLARIPIRTRYFDDFLVRCLENTDSITAPTQLVILGAGMDTRAYRIDALASVPNMTVYEVDQDSVLSLKTTLIAHLAPAPSPKCPIVRVSADLAKIGWDASLALAGYSWQSPAVWIIEGLVYYFDAEQVEALFRTLSFLACPGSRICVSTIATLRNPESRQLNSLDLAHPSSPDRDAVDKVSAIGVNLSSKFKWACPDPVSYFAKVGFTVDSVDALGGQNANYGRWPLQAPPSATQYIIMKPSLDEESDG